MALKALSLLVSLAGALAGLAEKADLQLLAKKALQKKGLPFQKAMAVVKGIAEEDRRKAAYPDDDGSCPDEYSNYYSWCVPNCTKKTRDLAKTSCVHCPSHFRTTCAHMG